MNGLLLNSMEEKTPIEIIYLSDKGEISFRTVIVKKVEQYRIHVYCLTKQQPRIFKRANILSAAKSRGRRAVNHA
ncbi:hypothetical protein [Peribacillus asahii]|uniref:hypothetical protein n=1 Tax=Peribacillus asahii TaxID=228899 RepID=UPI003806FE01